MNSEFIEFSYQPTSQSGARTKIAETMELLREQIEDDSDIEQDSYLFQVHKCDAPL